MKKRKPIVPLSSWEPLDDLEDGCTLCGQPDGKPYIARYKAGDVKVVLCTPCLVDVVTDYFRRGLLPPGYQEHDPTDSAT